MPRNSVLNSVAKIPLKLPPLAHNDANAFYLLSSTEHMKVIMCHLVISLDTLEKAVEFIDSIKKLKRKEVRN